MMPDFMAFGYVYQAAIEINACKQFSKNQPSQHTLHLIIRISEYGTWNYDLYLYNYFKVLLMHMDETHDHVIHLVNYVLCMYSINH